MAERFNPLDPLGIFNPRRVWSCKRGRERWSGGLIIIARDENRARQIFEQEEQAQPIEVIRLKVPGEGILYDDVQR